MNTARSEGQFEALRRPIMAFHIGVTGHRSLPDANLGELQSKAAEFFRRVRAEVLAIHATIQAEETPIYQAAPPVLRCICGLAEGADSILAEAALNEGWQLVAVLPFSPDEFAQDFEGAARDKYSLLLASAEAVCALDGERTTGHSYADVGDIIVEQADMLLTIWDGKRAHGLGGTGDVVRYALNAGLAVAWLPPTQTPTISWLGPTHDRDVVAVLRDILLPPESKDGFPQACFADRPRGDGWAATVQRAYDKIVALGYRSPIVAPVAPRAALSTANPSELHAAFETSDRLAAEYAARYRSAGLLRYGLILPATLASLVGWYGAGWMQPIGNLVDFVVLVFIVLFSARGGWEPSHRRYLMYRALAEYIRYARLLMPLRAVALTPGAEAHEARAADWTSWYGRAVVRQQGLPPVAFDAGLIAEAVEFVSAEAESQVRFLLSRADRFDFIAARLRQIGVALSIAGVAFSGGRAVLLMAGTPAPFLRGFNELALVLPAMAPVFLGLLSFNEYSKLASRYRSVAAALSTQIAALGQVAPQRGAVLTVARRIVGVMLAERDDWRQLMQSRTISAY